MPDTTQISSCNDSYCAKTTSTQYRWHFNIQLSNNSSNITSISPPAVNRGKNVQVTVKPGTYQASTGGCGGGTTTAYYTINNNNFSATMGGNAMSTGNGAGQYTLGNSGNNNVRVATFYGVTGDILITAVGTQ